jgi:hypothetical protein
MRARVALSTLVFVLVAFTGVSQALNDVYKPQTKFWMEKFQGGGPGQEGNVLMATGKGFMFQHAILEEATLNPDNSYTTTYIGGELTLNPSGPWASKVKGKKPFRTLKASDITATNHSTYDPVTGKLIFELTFGGKFDNANLSYCAKATYDGFPQIKLDDEGKPVFQRGFSPEFKVEIVFKECESP